SLVHGQPVSSGHQFANLKAWLTRCLERPAARKALALRTKADNETPAEATRRIAKINRLRSPSTTRLTFVIATSLNVRFGPKADSCGAAGSIAIRLTRRRAAGGLKARRDPALLQS